MEYQTISVLTAISTAIELADQAKLEARIAKQQLNDRKERLDKKANDVLAKYQAL